MDERFQKINRLLSQYSLGQFDKHLNVSTRLDEIDAFIAGINMLGEELKTATISRNYFTNIFNSVSDMVFILNERGVIEKINKSASEQLKRSSEILIGKPIDDLQVCERPPLFENLSKLLKNEKGSVSKKTIFQDANEKAISVLLTPAYLLDESKRKRGILLTAKDITLQLKTERLIIRTIIDTEEKERSRLAKDLHDSLGQPLSAIKFFISTLAGSLMNEEDRAILIKSNEILTEVMTDMRNICFHLMPTTLEEFGLFQAVKEICSKTRYRKKINFLIKESGLFPKLSKELEIDIYRVIQEFINNALRHGEASKISIKFNCFKKSLKITLLDNGKGFDYSQIRNRGMGLQNVKSRIKSHNGEIIITSEIGKGTRYLLDIPVN